MKTVLLWTFITCYGDELKCILPRTLSKLKSVVIERIVHQNNRQHQRESQKKKQNSETWVVSHNINIHMCCCFRLRLIVARPCLLDPPIHASLKQINAFSRLPFKHIQQIYIRFTTYHNGTDSNGFGSRLLLRVFLSVWMWITYAFLWIGILLMFALCLWPLSLSNALCTWYKEVCASLRLPSAVSFL